MSSSLRTEPPPGAHTEPLAGGFPGTDVPKRPGRLRPVRRHLGLVLAVGVPLVVGIVHVLLVAPHYHVGSFDDDASYILSAKAILAGGGLTGRLPSGALVVSAYPPGYSLLLVPLVWIGGTGAALRALSLVCYAALFPLTWRYLGTRRLPEPFRVAVLMLMALNPVLATFGTMVMAETPFLVLFLVTLLLVDRWSTSGRALSPAGIAVIVAVGGMVWLKEAAIAMVAGLALWLVLRREVRKAVAVAGGTLVLLAPVAIARLVSGVPLTGARYSEELGGYYTGNLVDRLSHVVSAAAHYVSTALPASVVPSGSPFSGWTYDVLRVAGWHVPVLCILGLVVWARRYRDAAVAVVLCYVAETLLWPYINERRVILVLPVVLAWYALGGWVVGAALLRWWRQKNWARGRLVRPGLAAVCATAIVAPLVAQFPRDYLFALGQSSSQPEASPYAAILARLGAPRDVVETDYESTLALVSGHPTADGAFLASLTSCPDQAIRAALSADHASYLLTGALNKPEQVDSPCLLAEGTSQPWAIRLFRTGHDQATVFELVGPGTPNPGLADLTAPAPVSGSTPVVAVPVAQVGEGDNPGTVPSTLAVAGTGVLTWDWGGAATVRQVSVGAAGAVSGPTAGVRVELRLPSGAWTSVAAAGTAVGDIPGTAPFLLASFPQGITATALRVIIQGSGQVSAMDVHALGEGPPA